MYLSKQCWNLKILIFTLSFEIKKCFWSETWDVRVVQSEIIKQIKWFQVDVHQQLTMFSDVVFWKWRLTHNILCQCCARHKATVLCMKGWMEKDILDFYLIARKIRMIKWTFSLEGKYRFDLEVFIVLSKPKEGR